MNKTLTALTDIGLPFVLIFGILHMTASFLIAQEIWTRPALIVYQSFDLPFLLAALTYGSAKLILHVEKVTEASRASAITISTISGLIMIGAITINFYFPDVKI